MLLMIGDNCMSDVIFTNMPFLKKVMGRPCFSIPNHRVIILRIARGSIGSIQGYDCSLHYPSVRAILIHPGYTFPIVLAENWKSISTEFATLGWSCIFPLILPYIYENSMKFLIERLIEFSKSTSVCKSIIDKKYYIVHIWKQTWVEWMSNIYIRMDWMDGFQIIIHISECGSKKGSKASLSRNACLGTGSIRTWPYPHIDSVYNITLNSQETLTIKQDLYSL